MTVLSRENSIEHAIFIPAAHTGVDAVPIAKAARKLFPFAPMFEDMQHRIQHREIVNCDIASLTGRSVSYFFIGQKRTERQ